MAAGRIKDYDYYDITELDLSTVSYEEREAYAKSTLEVLSKNKRKKTKANFLISLASGLLTLKDGEFIEINGFRVKYNKGNVTKEELKVIKKVFSTYKMYVWLKIFINLISNSNSEGKVWINPHIALRK